MKKTLNTAEICSSQESEVSLYGMLRKTTHN